MGPVAAQKRLEDIVLPFVNDALNLTGEGRVALAGGVFANVKLNQRILELPNVEEIYIHPNMTDGGLATGAALFAYYRHFDNDEKRGPRFIGTVLLGPHFDDKRIEKALNKYGIGFRKVDRIEEEIASAIHSNRIVGHFHGRMEYGPRALGNRSILASPADPEINTYLNDRLHRTEFMPFAPAILEDYADSYLKGWKPDHVASRFMTITYEVTDEFVDKAPAAVHVDNTARPQIVRKNDNSRFYKIIGEYFKSSGIPLVINTSFNMHEEPIVCTPEDAIRSYQEGAVDVLVMNDFWIESC